MKVSEWKKLVELNTKHMDDDEIIDLPPGSFDHIFMEPVSARIEYELNWRRFLNWFEKQPKRGEGAVSRRSAWAGWQAALGREESPF